MSPEVLLVLEEVLVVTVEVELPLRVFEVEVLVTLELVFWLVLPGDDVVGTTTSRFTCAEAMELPRNMDNPKLLQRINLRVGDDINHPLVEIKIGSCWI